jgi:outer membrane protein, adhesin transport system
MGQERSMASTPRLTLLSALMLAAALAQAQKLPSPLIEAAKTAVASSPDVQERWKAFRAADQGPAIAGAQWKPRADLTASVGREWRRNVVGTETNLGTSAVELSLTQLLFDGGVVNAAMRQASRQKVEAYLNLAETSEAVALEVARAYLDLLRQRELVELATENYAEHKVTANMLQERVGAAVGRRSDLEQAIGRLSQAESTLVTETIALNTAAARYLRMVGNQAPGKLPTWPEGLVLAKFPASAQELLNQGLRSSHYIKGAWENVHAADQAVEGRQAAFMPTVQARVWATRDTNASGVSGTGEQRVAELLLQHNFYRGGADVAAKTRSVELAQRARDQLEAACREVRQTLSVAYKDVGVLETRMRLLDTQRLAVDKTRTAYRQQYDIGQRTLLDLLDTQKEFFEANRSYTNARFDQLSAQARTLAAMGKLVSTLGAGSADLSAGADAARDSGEGPYGDVCPVQVTAMDSLERIKAELEPPRRPAAITGAAGVGSYAVLLPNPDGSVGRIVVKGPAGEQEVSRAQQGVPLTGAVLAAPVAASAIERDFGAAIQAQPPLPEKITLRFASGSTKLTPEGEAAFQKVLERIKARATVDITVAGFADTVASAKLNETLALKRAEAVAQRLRDSGFGQMAIAVESYGKRVLEVPTEDNVNEPRNRRVLVTVR